MPKLPGLKFNKWPHYLLASVVVSCPLLSLEIDKTVMPVVVSAETDQFIPIASVHRKRHVLDCGHGRHTR
jgi:hypothetical protein